MKKHGVFFWTCSLIIAGVTLLIYANTFQAPFVLDDHHFVREDPAKHMVELTWENVEKAALEGRPKNRLLPNISFAVNYYLHGFDMPGYHLVNIILHITTGLLLFLLIQHTLLINGISIYEYKQTLWLAPFLCTLLWMVHPVHTQSVTYIYQRMTIMAALFYVLSLFLYAWGRSKWRSHKRLTPGVGIAFVGCFLSAICAVLSKQNAGMLPIIILLYEWFFFQNLSISFSKRQMLWIAGSLLFFGAIAILYLGGSPVDRILTAYTWRPFSLGERVMTEWRVIIYYVSLFFCPSPGRLNLDHDYPLSTAFMAPLTTPLTLGAIIALIIVGIYRIDRHRLLSFCLLWFVLNLIIESSVIGIEIIFEHRTYLPFMLLPLPVVWISLNHIRPRSLGIGAVVAIAILFSLWTYQRNNIWKDPVTFAHDRVLKSPCKARPNMEMGVYMARLDKYENALYFFKKALQSSPTPRDANNIYNNLGNVMAKLGHLEKAIAYYEQSLAINPKNKNARENLEKVKQFMKRDG